MSAHLMMVQRVRFSPGDDIHDCCEEMVKLAKSCDCVVTADFNTVELEAFPWDDDGKRLEKQYREELKP